MSRYGQPSNQMADNAGQPAGASQPDTPPSVRGRLLVMLAVAIAVGFLTWLNLHVQSPGAVANDYTWYWRGARALIDGHSPYVVIQPTGRFPFDAGFNYPLTVPILVLPLALMSPTTGAVVFMTFSAALLAWALTESGYWQLTMLLSIPFYISFAMIQLSPLLVAAALLPAAGWALTLKPQLGLAAFAYRPSRNAFIAAFAFLVVTLIAYPTWPLEWMHTLGHRIKGNYGVPVTQPGGFLLLLALLRWRRPEARLLFMMAIVPQSLLYYDQLILWLIPRTRVQMMTLSLLSAVAFVIGAFRFPESATTADWSAANAPGIIALLYLPCLLMVLRRPNEGEPPAWPLATVPSVWRYRLQTSSHGARSHRVSGRATPAGSGSH